MAVIRKWLPYTCSDHYGQVQLYLLLWAIQLVRAYMNYLAVNILGKYLYIHFLLLRKYDMTLEERERETPNNKWTKIDHIPSN